jgi:hypothetical protein
MSIATYYAFQSNEPTVKVQNSKGETDGTLINGMYMAVQGGKPGWKTCMSCLRDYDEGQGELARRVC